jgi:nitroimidazol reductase NimA-like FMN-containing flavoprotein (pyridoxamine 5'-phosphate oxidase superfamily)
MSVSDDELREMALEGNVEAIDELREALAHAVTQVRDLHNNWPESDLHEPVRATLDRAKPLVPEAFE